MTEVLFYHLESIPLETVLPDLLVRSLAKGWRAVVQVGSEDRLGALDAHLWTYDDASFLPHGTVAERHGESQPVWLTVGAENPNGAAIRFFVDGATADSFEGYQRIVFIFDSVDVQAVERARSAWKAANACGCETTYWRQDEGGKWRRQA